MKSKKDFLLKKILSILILLLAFNFAFSQQKTQNLIIVTLDGMRWQEVFGGADSVLLNDSVFTANRDELKKKFWANSSNERREMLLPFFWNVIGKHGQLYGNRWYGNSVNNANRYRFSYPGYNEIFTGYPDTAVNSNDKIPNRNENVLEFLNKQDKFKGKIVAFTSWDVFDAIFNEQRAGFPVNSGFDQLNFKSSPELQLLNEMQMKVPRIFGDAVRPDFLTYYIAKEYLKVYKPKVLYIGFGETDEYAHEGKYDQYLSIARLTDDWIADLWTLLQSLPEYKGKTTLLITTDHGRGDEVKSNWRHHGEKINDAYQIWIAAVGPDTTPLGEVKSQGQLFQEQVAATIAALLGYQFKGNHTVAAPIERIFRK